eukprot:scaffold17859_cov64-Cyclotella_meneghiniana.AAC.1
MSSDDTNRAVSSSSDDNDPHNIYSRFVTNQRVMFTTALSEIRRGEKESCWLWFVLPTAPYVVNGVERGSSINRHFALRGDDAVKAFLTFPPQKTVSTAVTGDDYKSFTMGNNGTLTEQHTPTDTVDLKKNYLQMAEAILHQLSEKNARPVQLFGPIDSPKVRSSIELFHRVALDMGEDQCDIAKKDEEVIQINSCSNEVGWCKCLKVYNTTASLETVDRKSFRLSLEDERQTLERGALELANMHIHVMTPSDMAAVWSLIPRVLPKHYRKYKKPPKRKRDAGQIESDVRNLLEITTNSVDTFQRKELATIMLGRSRVIHNILKARQQKRMNVYQRALCNIFLDDKNNEEDDDTATNTIETVDLVAEVKRAEV